MRLEILHRFPPAAFPKSTGAGAFLAALAACLLAAAPARGVAPEQCAEVDPAVVLPAANACPGLSAAGEAFIARTVEDLRQIIDGQAGLYGELGFVAAAFQNYGTETGSAVLSAFNQGSFHNATAVYDNPASGTGAPVPGWPGSGPARLRYDSGGVTVQFRENCFFVSVGVTAAGEEAPATALCLARETVERIAAATPARVPTWGRIKSRFP